MMTIMINTRVILSILFSTHVALGLLSVAAQCIG